MPYGDSYQVYGAGVCPKCTVPHARFLSIKETKQSRFRLMQFNAELMSQVLLPEVGPVHLLNANPRLPDRAFRGVTGRLNSIGAGQSFMMGLLISGPTILVAASGNNNGRLAQVAALKNYILCPAINGMANHVSRVGRQIPAAEYGAAQRPDAPAPGNCAAPRLIEHAFSIQHVAANWRNWEMSEIYYQPNTARRTRDDLYWMHGLSAHHCATCEALIPLLMCTRPDVDF